jgi:hypothetical protein
MRDKNDRKAFFDKWQRIALEENLSEEEANHIVEEAVNAVRQQERDKNKKVE